MQYFQVCWTWYGFDILLHHIHDNNSSEIHLLLLPLLRPPIFFSPAHSLEEKQDEQKGGKKEKAEVEAEEGRRWMLRKNQTPIY